MNMLANFQEVIDCIEGDMGILAKRRKNETSLFEGSFLLCFLFSSVLESSRAEEQTQHQRWERKRRKKGRKKERKTKRERKERKGNKLIVIFSHFLSFFLFSLSSIVVDSCPFFSAASRAVNPSLDQSTLTRAVPSPAIVHQWIQCLARPFLSHSCDVDRQARRRL